MRWATIRLPDVAVEMIYQALEFWCLKDEDHTPKDEERAGAVLQFLNQISYEKENE